MIIAIDRVIPLRREKVGALSVLMFNCDGPLVGRFLRRSQMDHLPMIIDVIAGRYSMTINKERVLSIKEVVLRKFRQIFGKEE